MLKKLANQHQPLHVLISLCARCHTTRELDTALGNRTLRTQPTDYSLIY